MQCTAGVTHLISRARLFVPATYQGASSDGMNLQTMAMLQMPYGIDQVGTEAPKYSRLRPAGNCATVVCVIAVTIGGPGLVPFDPGTE